MSASPIRSRGTAPTSLQQASGGVLAEWLLQSTSASRPATPYQRAGVNDGAMKAADSRNRLVAAGATPCPGCEERTAMMEETNGNMATDTKYVCSLRTNCLEESENRVMVNEDGTQVLSTEVGVPSGIEIVNQIVCSFNCGNLKCICGGNRNYQINQQFHNSEVDVDSQTSCRIGKIPKELRKGTGRLTLETILNLPCDVSSYEENFHSLQPVMSESLPHKTNMSSIKISENEQDDEFQRKCKRCRLTDDTPDEKLYDQENILRHLKTDVETRARGYFNVIKKHMPEGWFHTTLQNSLERLSFRSKFLDDRGSLRLWILDLLTILHLCRLTNFVNVSLDFPSFAFDILIAILSLINNFELSQQICSISLPFDENDTVRSHRFRHYTSQSENNNVFGKALSRFPTIVQSFKNLRCLHIRSSNEKLLRCLQHLHLSSLFLTSSHLKNRTILKNFLGLQCSGDDFDMLGKPLSTSLQTLHIPNCKISMVTYRSLIQIFPNLADLQVKPKLEFLTQRQSNLTDSNNFNDNFMTYQNSNTHFKSLSLTCDELSFFDVRTHFPFLQHLSVQLDNADTLQVLSIVSELKHLETLQLKSLPTFTHFYRNTELDVVYPFLKKTLESLTKLTLQNFDISTDSLSMLSTLPKLTSLTLKSCWIKSLDYQPKLVSMFKNLTELHLTSIPSKSVTNCLFSNSSIQCLTIVPQENEMQVSVTSSTERSLRDLLSSGNLASLDTLCISSYFLSQSLVHQLSLLPRLRKVTTIEQPGASARDLLKFVSMTPSHITFCSES